MDSDRPVSARNTVILLERLWLTSGERLAARCRGLSDEELLWEPVDESWNLVPDAAHPGGWTYPYDFDPPHPHPVTSVGWRRPTTVTCSNPARATSAAAGPRAR